MADSGKQKKSTDRTYQFKICLWIALNKHDNQIKDLLKERFDIDMSVQNISDNYRHAKKWLPIIRYLRERYLNNISRIPIANKAHRLWLLNQASEEALTWHTKSINEYGEIQEQRIGMIPAFVKEARAEVEGDKPLIDQSHHLHLTVQTIDLEERVQTLRGEPLASFMPRA